MATLTETAYHTRKTINWTILAVIAYLILRILWSGLVTIFLVIFPPQAPPPNHAFGKLPPIKFAQTASPAAEITYKLETIEGAVPGASESAAVYFLPKNPPNLLALSKTQEFAQRLELDPNPIQESKNIYKFNDPQLTLRYLRYDIVSNNFLLRYAFEKDAGIFIEKNLPLLDAAQAEARSILQTYELYPADLAEGRSQVTFLRLSGDTLTPTTSLSQSDAVRVDFFRRAINGMPLFTPIPEEGPVSFIFAGTSIAKKRILQFSYIYWPIDQQTIATYPLITSAQAWQELQSGNGFIARYPNQGVTAVIRNVYLGYYDSLEPQNYLQPIFVFEGDNGFLAYVEAVSPEWIEK